MKLKEAMFSTVCVCTKTEWLGQASQGHEMYCHDFEVMGSNPSRVKLGVCSASF